MTDLEQFLLVLLKTCHNTTEMAIILQSYIAENGPVSDECGDKVNELLAKAKSN